MGRPEEDRLYAADPDYAVADGPFDPSWTSLQGFECPQWFRDAKLGFWAHWGPQSVPMYGDWYARNMYIEGSDQYRFHCRTYGHPSRFGFKDVCKLWKAEHFDPEGLVQLYKGAGARYFVALAVHHDNFDCWNSRYHTWNSVNVGPQKDIVGLWRAAALKAGLRFGVTEHLERSYSWFNVNKFADKVGPYAGVPYDGADPANEGFYFPAHGDTARSYPANPPEWWKKQWFRRIQDLVATYEPDLLYTDGSVPFGEVGRRLIADYYNRNAARHGGTSEAVYTLKHFATGPNALDHGEYVDGIGVLDLERGVIEGIRETPWQTDTCIGGWYYDRRASTRRRLTSCGCWPTSSARTATSCSTSRCVPMERQMTSPKHVVDGIAAWMAVNGEAIYETRPWHVFGEGPTQAGSGAFDERERAWTPEDYRFTRKGGTVYALQMAWPSDRRAVIVSMKLESGVRVGDVRLVGHDAIVAWRQTGAGLEIDLPVTAPSDAVHAFAVRLVEGA